MEMTRYDVANLLIMGRWLKSITRFWKVKFKQLSGTRRRDKRNFVIRFWMRWENSNTVEQVKILRLSTFGTKKRKIPAAILHNKLSCSRERQKTREEGVFLATGTSMKWVEIWFNEVEWVLSSTIYDQDQMKVPALNFLRHRQLSTVSNRENGDDVPSFRALPDSKNGQFGYISPERIKNIWFTESSKDYFIAGQSV